MNIFVGKLSPQTQGDDLRKIFQEFGVIVSARVIFDRSTGRSKRFGFVLMENKSDALRAIRALNRSRLQGNTIAVRLSQ